MTEGAYDWTALAHRALVAAAVYGLMPRSPRVACATFDRARPVIHAIGPSIDAVAVPAAPNVLVTVDDPSLDPPAFVAACESLGAPEGVLAVVVSSTSAAGLVRARLETHGARTDAFARAAAWAANAASTPLAPPASASRIRELVAHAAGAGLALVEPEVTLVRTWTPRTAIDRAILSTIVSGATSRPLVFVPESRAPKGGLAKLREERVLDGWVQAVAVASFEPTTLFGAALTLLAEDRAPVTGKELLREARSRWSEAARARGERVTLSSSDGPTLVKALLDAWAEGTLALYALDPTTRLLEAP